MIGISKVPASRIAAYAILVAVVSIILLSIAVPLTSMWSVRREQIENLSEMISRLRRTAAEAPTMQAELVKLSLDNRAGSAIWTAANPTLAAANLQAEVRRIVESNGAQVQTIQQIPPVTEDSVTRIGARLNLQADMTELSKTLYSLENHSPILLIRGVSIHGSDDTGGHRGVKAFPLNIQIEVTAMTASSE